MYALLVLGDVRGNLKVLVNVKSKGTERKFYGLLEDNRHREAFDLLRDKASVEECLAPGRKLSRIPKVTLVEDLI